MVTKNIVEEIKKQLIKAYNPQEIYLYDPTSQENDQDVDILVVLEAVNQPRHQLMVQGHKALFNLEVGKNIFVYTQNEFDQESKNRTTLSFKIKHQGQKIYAKA